MRKHQRALLAPAERAWRGRGGARGGGGAEGTRHGTGDFYSPDQKRDVIRQKHKS